MNEVILESTQLLILVGAARHRTAMNSFLIGCLCCAIVRRCVSRLPLTKYLSSHGLLEMGSGSAKQCQMIYSSNDCDLHLEVILEAIDALKQKFERTSRRS